MALAGTPPTRASPPPPARREARSGPPRGACRRRCSHVLHSAPGASTSAQIGQQPHVLIAAPLHRDPATPALQVHVLHVEPAEDDSWIPVAINTRVTSMSRRAWASRPPLRRPVAGRRSWGPRLGSPNGQTHRALRLLPSQPRVLAVGLHRRQDRPRMNLCYNEGPRRAIVRQRSSCGTSFSYPWLCLP